MQSSLNFVSFSHINAKTMLESANTVLNQISYCKWETEKQKKWCCIWILRGNFRLLAYMSGDASCGKKSFPSKGLLFYDICNDIVRQSKF
jgi:hypothetical protein